MSGRFSLTQQEADPIGGGTAAPLVAIGAGTAVAISVVSTFAHRAEIVSPFAAVLGILLLVAAAIALVTGILPSRGSFASERVWLVVTIATAAAVAEYVSTMGNDAVLYDDYGPITIGVLLLCMAPYASWAALLIAAGLSSGVLAILVAGNAAAASVSQPVASLVLVGSVAIVALAAAGASYSYSIVGSILRWQREVNREALEQEVAEEPADAEPFSGPTIGGSPRVALVAREVLPFLASVVAAERLSVADVDRARELAEGVQAAMKAGIEATWLDDLADALRSGGTGPGIEMLVDDPSGAAARLSSDQRTALTAIISWLGGSTRSSEVRVAVVEGAGAGRIEVTAIPAQGPPRHRDLERIVAIARAVGYRTESMISRERTIVELNYPVG
ncbi:hypothetical protein [Agromyces soli]|uniref:Uncharacterized protein n=1 Tax=Agromyces soli TaxID=659012 RepID=A0ABY4AP80_9MICO|nr:hypothetical protein [Agromyces soli]UOE24815.1 hypothetical protein MTP13_10605 [Agromyces soli]